MQERGGRPGTINFVQGDAHTHTHTHTHTPTPTPTPTPTHPHTHTPTHPHTHTPTHLHTYTPTRVHAHIDVHTRPDKLAKPIILDDFGEGKRLHCTLVLLLKSKYLVTFYGKCTKALTFETFFLFGKPHCMLALPCKETVTEKIELNHKLIVFINAL